MPLNLSLEQLTLPPKFIIYVKSHLLFGVKNREYIRKTWGRSVKIVFICVTELPTLEKFKFSNPDVELMSDMLVLGNFRETADHLTIKVIEVLKFHVDCYQEKNENVYSMITDDDVYFFTDRLLKEIIIPLKISTEYLVNVADQGMKNIILGRILWTGKPIRALPGQMGKGKYAVAPEVYPYDLWPPFCTGICCIFTPSIPKLLLNQVDKVPHIKHLDDAYLGVLAHFNNMEVEKGERNSSDLIHFRQDKRFCHGRENEMLSCDYINFHRRMVDANFVFERNRQCFIENRDEFTDPNY